ncbi:MAG: helix-turn-helix transcriptional regulator [Lentisphaeria bacterium]|nr:helix-turn-helix transcriptional regulator [Lentisphaeria bacterium]MBO5990811.1 helix-turn-helix transcriptional regulator [Lentisphaeria bacterium]MBO7152739.1 helix-turn-helix transcriptional regulator [Lentisphaeria bacterium]
MDTHSLEPEIQAFEKLLGCKVCLHIYSDVFFRGNTPLTDRKRHSHRQTHPEKCGREIKSYCVRHCMQDLNRRMSAHPEQDVFAVHCRNGCFELVSPVYRGGRRVLTVFIGLLDLKQREKIRLAARILPVFASGLEAKARELSSLEMRPQNTVADRIENFIERHYASDISTSDAARELCVSVSRLCHILKEAGKGSFSKMLTAKRIHHAKQLLAFADPDLRLFEVAELCGFREYEHFSRTFKRETGKSPAEWRAGHGD